MKVLYIKPQSTDAAFHFSVEEYFMTVRFPPEEPIFMLWQADKCAMLGSNQVAQIEVDITYAKVNHIQITRRQSGGGTIYTDLGTLLYTLILPEGDRDMARKAVAEPIIRALNKLNIPAKFEGRNDILVAGKKVSGIAQYARGDRICTHGSLLYDTDLDMLTRVLQVDEDKIRSKAIASVRSRVVNIREHMKPPLSIMEFWALLEEKLREEWEMGEYRLTDADMAGIDKIAREKYANPDWTHGRSPKFSFHNSKRFPAGKVECFLDIVQGRIAACSIRGDFLGTIPISGLEQLLENQRFQYEAVEAAIRDMDLRPYLGDITRAQFLSCIFGEAV